MFEFLKIQYQLGKISKDQLNSLIYKAITEEEYNTILEEEIAAQLVEPTE